MTPTRKIVELRAENVKRLSAVEIRPDGSLVILGGKNGAGKSSVLDSIIYALGGASALPGRPVRNGESQATIEIVLDGEPKLVVKRRIKADGTTTLEIKQLLTDGLEAKVTSPQKLLDQLCGKIAFDPLAFTRLGTIQQAALLREVVGIDTTKVDQLEDGYFSARTDVNRRIKDMKSQLGAAKHYPDAPAEPVSVAALMSELEEAQATNRAAHAAALAAQQKEREAQASRQLEGKFEVEIERLQKEMARVRSDLTLQKQVTHELKAEAEIATSKAASMAMIDDAPIQEQIKGAEAINSQVRANQERAKIQSLLADETTRAERLTEQIEKARTERVAIMNAAKWPVEGLGFDDDGVTFNGLPFEQCSSAEQLRISTAIGLAQHPTLRVLLIKDASLLDEDSLAAIAELAAEHGGQVWLERVSVGEECTVVIADGMVAGAERPELQEATV